MRTKPEVLIAIETALNFLGNQSFGPKTSWRGVEPGDFTTIFHGPSVSAVLNVEGKTPFEKVACLAAATVAGRGQWMISHFGNAVWSFFTPALLILVPWRFSF